MVVPRDDVAEVILVVVGIHRRHFIVQLLWLPVLFGVEQLALRIVMAALIFKRQVNRDFFGLQFRIGVDFVRSLRLVSLVCRVTLQYIIRLIAAQVTLASRSVVQLLGFHLRILD